ncbi:MAG: hypothetical protein U1A06_19695, partial [Hoeflea sp.]|nr:hypothetical protein [Hoeflea sp.]
MVDRYGQSSNPDQLHGRQDPRQPRLSGPGQGAEATVGANEGMLALAAIADLARLIDPPVAASRKGRAVRRTGTAGGLGATRGRANPVDVLRCRIVWRLVAQLFAMAGERDGAETQARRKPRCHRRQVAMYLSHVVLSVPYATVAAAFGRDR